MMRRCACGTWIQGGLTCLRCWKAAQSSLRDAVPVVVAGPVRVKVRRA